MLCQLPKTQLSAGKAADLKAVYIVSFVSFFNTTNCTVEMHNRKVKENQQI